MVNWWILFLLNNRKNKIRLFINTNPQILYNNKSLLPLVLSWLLTDVDIKIRVKLFKKKYLRGTIIKQGLSTNFKATRKIKNL